MLIHFKNWNNLIEKVIKDFNPGDKIEKYIWPGDLSFGVFNSTQAIEYSIPFYRFKSSAPKKALAITTWTDIRLNSVPGSDYEMFIQAHLDSKFNKEK